MDLEVEYEATQYIPERWTMSNGDPGYPAEGGDFEVYSVHHCGEDIFELLSDRAMEEIEEAFEKWCNTYEE